MLEELSVRDFALIDRLTVGFSPGLNLLTGETGAGKSLLVGALSFLLGAKADTGVIRAGAEESLVTGIVDVSGNEAALAWLRDRGLEPEEGRVLLRRGIKANGRGSAYIQNQSALRSDLAEFTRLVVDLHGQHEHQSLLEPENHRLLLDRYARIQAEVEAFGARFSELAAERRAYEAALASERERGREMEFLRFAVDEIAKAKLKVGEEEELEDEERKLSQHEKLFAAVDAAHEALSASGAEAGGGALPVLRRARAGLEAALAIDPSLSDLARRADDAFYELEDVADSLRRYQEGLRFSPERLEEVESRLADLHKLKKKYGSTIEGILARFEEDRLRLDRLEHWEEDRGEAERRIAEMEGRLLAEALAISEKRKAAAAELQSGIEAIVRTLGMPKARFLARIARKELDGGKPVVGPHGVDEVEFLIAPNPGEPAKPLARIASGGELSRVALAAKTVLAGADAVGTLIFDEVDAGIGGEVAVAVGEHLKALGRSRQVLCITHLASIAVRADNHYRVDKEISGGRTSTRVSRMEGRARAEEIARMLAGDSREEASIAHAMELLRKHGDWTDG
ncbi:MAG TPA: DNA repair protein RecN [Spirochaetales bacterium]|nr:DNA repair protein RecN [Spirochaetales bacterium]HRY53443.1 DNA repair protein RecN [Spirochaetia bacterium]HRZ65125.1 DNA repair protein RecN [Spirochaetia bacterium]